MDKILVFRSIKELSEKEFEAWADAQELKHFIELQEDALGDF